MQTLRLMSRLCGAEDPGEDRVDMLGVIAEVEFFADFGFRQGGAHFAVAQKFFEEVLALFPDLHGVALHEAIGILARQAGLGERQKHALRMHEAANLFMFFSMLSG